MLIFFVEIKYDLKDHVVIYKFPLYSRSYRTERHAFESRLCLVFTINNIKVMIQMHAFLFDLEDTLGPFSSILSSKFIEEHVFFLTTT